MDNSVHNEDLLIRYLDGELTAAEKADVEQRLKTEPLFREQYQSLLVAVQAVKHLGRAQQVAGIHQEMMQELKDRKNSSPVFKINRAFRYTMAVAASLLVVFVGIRLYRDAQLSPEKIYNETFVEFNVANSRSADYKLSTIETAYQQKAFENVVSAVRSLHLDAKDSLLVGLSYLHLNNLTSATNWFRTLSAGQSDYRQDAEFYLSLAYLKTKAYPQALSIMQSIRNNPSHIYHDQVSDETVEKLKKLADK